MPVLNRIIPPGGREGRGIKHQADWDETAKMYCYNYASFCPYRGILSWNGLAYYNDSYPAMDPEDHDCNDGVCYCPADDQNFNSDTLLY